MIINARNQHLIMKKATVLIDFENTSSRESSIYSSELQRFISDKSSDVKVEQVKSDPNSMDFGGTLAVILSSGAAVALANGIAAWLRSRTNASIQLRRQVETDGRVSSELIAAGITHQTAVDLVKTLAKQF